MVDETHVVTGHGCSTILNLRWAVDSAVEAGERRNLKRCLKDIVELWHQVGVLGRSINVGDESYEACAVIDHGLESRPLAGRFLGSGCVSQLSNAGTVNGLSKLIRFGIVGVDKQESDNLILVRLHPHVDFSQPVLEWASIENATGSVTK